MSEPRPPTPTPAPPPIRLSWGAFDLAVRDLEGRIRHRIPEGLVGIWGEPRGGLVLAVALSHRLGLPLLPAIPPGPEPFLWVDDVVDSGRTMRAALMHRAGLMLAAAWVSKFPPSDHLIAATYCQPGRWVVFPWEDPDRADADHAAYLAR